MPALLSPAPPRGSGFGPVPLICSPAAQRALHTLTATCSRGIKSPAKAAHCPSASHPPMEIAHPAVIHPVYKVCPLPACLQGMRPGRISSVGGGGEAPWVHGSTPVRGKIPPWNREVAGASRVSTGVDAPGECWGQREVLVSVYLGRE